MQKNDFFPVSNRAPQNGNLERRGIRKNSNFVFNVKHASNIQDQTRHVLLVVAYYKASTKKTRIKQNNEWTMDLSCTSVEFTNYFLKNTQRVDVMKTLQNHKKKRLLGFRKETPLRNDRGRPHRRRTMPNAHARTKIHAHRHGRTWQNGGWKGDVRRKSDKPYRERNNDTVKTQEHFEYNKKYQRKRNTWPNNPQDPMPTNGHRGHHGHTFINVFMVGIFTITHMATMTITYHIWCVNTRLASEEEHKLKAVAATQIR